MGAAWDDDLEPSEWDERRAIAMKQGLAQQRTLHQDSLRAALLASEAETRGGVDGGDATVHQQPRQRPRRTPKPTKPKLLLGSAEAEDGMTASQRRELQQALENSRAIQQMQARPELPEAPVFTPTADEFQDPLAYIASIRAVAQDFGACKIVPPAGWRGGAANRSHVPESLSFEPRLMPIHKLQQGVGFQPAAATTLAAYKEKADEFKAALCARHGLEPADEEALEALFWRIVQTQHEELVVQYGADLDVDTHASGFAADEGGEWNLRRLASHPDSLLAQLPAGVPGVSSPWLYVGMCYSSFCWHVEDLWMYSMARPAARTPMGQQL